MTARHAIRRAEAGGVVLATKRSKRWGFAIGFLLLAGGAVVGFEPSRDLAPERAPFTVLYLVLAVACLVPALASHRVVVVSGSRLLKMEERLGGIRIREDVLELTEQAEVRITRLTRERASYVLVVGPPDAPTTLDSSSWLREIEPLGRAVANALDLPLSAPDRHERR